ncbi:MAG: DUF364 domain-containing protein [Chloroflexi bacterium]|nr:DUF364 domain-containing protein [Chloroflexota bacterium]
MPLINDLLNSLQHDAPVRNLLIGVHWTAVCSRRCGLASTLGASSVHGEITLPEAGDLHTRSARELAEYARSENPLEVSVGVAAINSLLDVDESLAVEVNALDVLARRGAGKTVALVGHFPFVPKLRPAVGRLWVLEQHPIEDDFPAEAAPDLIPQADVVAVTGSALLNNTLGDLLALCRPGSEVMVLGPSTPLSPVLFAHGATLLAGTLVTDERLALRAIAQGAAFRQVGGVRLLTLAKDGWG